MKRVKKIIKDNNKLFSFIGLSYFDKMVIFLLPLAVLTLFQDKSVYVSIEYIYSIVVVLVPFLDFGICGYFFYAYRNADNFRNVIVDVVKIFHLIYLISFLIGVALILTHYFIYPFEKYIIYIVFRSVFVLAFAFFTSYYRLINKPQKALFVTLSANLISLSFLAMYFFSGKEFEFWLIFLGQILFCIVYFLLIFKRVLKKWKKSYRISKELKLLKKSILFSWPNIIQVFILMYIANYGKINALQNMTVDEGVLLSITQRFSMLIQLTHSAIIGYLMKELFVSGDLLAIKKNILFKYIFLLLTAVVAVIVTIIGYLYIFDSVYTIEVLMLNIALIVGYTFLWCVYSYFEIYYSRENKNIIKLYLALVNGTVFIGLFNFMTYSYLERITLAMFLSTFVTLLLSMYILKRRKYQLV